MSKSTFDPFKGLIDTRSPSSASTHNSFHRSPCISKLNEKTGEGCKIFSTILVSKCKLGYVSRDSQVCGKFSAKCKLYAERIIDRNVQPVTMHRKLKKIFFFFHILFARACSQTSCMPNVSIRYVYHFIAAST